MAGGPNGRYEYQAGLNFGVRHWPNQSRQYSDQSPEKQNSTQYSQKSNQGFQ